MRLFTIMLLGLSTLTLSACDTLPMNMGGTQASSNNSGTASGIGQTNQFINALEARRGTALSFAEQIEVQGLAGAAHSGLNGLQNGFLNSVAERTGMQPAVIAALLPAASKPLSESSAVARLEGKMGHALSASDQGAVRSATALRNNSLADIKTSLANKVASRTGMDPTVVQSLMPLLGF
jgi:hypothetical protein